MHQIVTAIMLLLLFGCNSQNLTEQEYKQQNQVTTIVSDVLFDKDISDLASYNIRKNSEIVILFDSKVPSKKYTEVVEYLRNHPAIDVVYAEQDGAEVCSVRL